ncbi:MAG: HEAT repeat protein, partial [Bradymonadia bacterium]
DLVPLLTLFVAHRSWPALDLVDLCHVARDALVERIAARPIDDPAWLRLLPVLAISPGRGASAAIRAILAAPAPPATIRAALGTVAVREDTEAENGALARLEEYCPEALRALTRVGGAATAQALEIALGLSEAPAAPWILAHQTPALVLLWQLIAARSTARAALLARINPGEMPAHIARDIASERSEAARRMALKSALFVRPDQALIRLADLGEDGVFDTLYGLLRETVVGLIDGAVPGDSPLDTAHTDGRPNLPASVRDALLEYGQRLARRGRIRPVSLVRGGEPGAAMMVEMALELALFGGLESAMQRCLLDAIQPYDVPGVAARLEPLLRSRDAEVRAAAVRLFVARAHGGQTHALIRLLRDDAPSTLRPAIAAMAEFAVVWTTPLVVAHLGHPQLEVARAAADALVRLDAVAATPAVVEQLAQRDDPRVRGLLLQAFDAAGLGPGPLVDALANADSTGRVRLLQALDSRMSPAWLRRLVVADHPTAPLLIEAVEAGKLRLGGSIERLDDELVRHGRPRIRTGPVTILERLRRAGWSAAEGRAAIADPAVDLQLFVRRFGREVVALLPHLSGGDRDRVAAHLEGLRPETARQALPILLDALRTAVDPRAAEGLMRLLMRIGSGLPSPLAGRAVDAVRGLTSALAGGAADDDAGALRWQTLGRLGAIPTRADLDAALDDTQFAPDTARAAIEVLRLALGARQVPAQPPPDLLSADDGALAAARARETRGAARVQLIGELIAAWPHAPAARAQALLDWLLDLQPLGAPPWILSADAMREPPPQPTPSMARRAALLDGLNDDDPERRTEAAVQLLDWPDVPEAQLEVLLAWLDCAVEVPVDRRWALADALHARPRLLTTVRGIALLDWLSVERQRHHADRLWGLWGSGDLELSARAGQMLRRLGPEFLLPRVAREIADARWGAADLLIDRPLVRSPLLEMVIDQLRAAGQLDRASTLERQASAGPLSTPTPLPAPRIKRRVSGHEALIETARGDDPRAARAALSQMVDAEAPGSLDLLVDLTRHADPARRILALRAVRQLADQRTYLDAALPFLDDPRPDVRRSVIEALSEARHPEALPRLIALLRDKTPAIRDAARTGVIRYEAAAVSALEDALRRARPDRRGLYARLIAACRDHRGR